MDYLVLQKIGRKHTARELLDSCKWIQDSFNKGDLASWNLDLIQNLPEQNVTSPGQETSNRTNEPVTKNAEKKVDSNQNITSEESNDKPNNTDNENNKDEVKE